MVCYHPTTKSYGDSWQQKPLTFVEYFANGGEPIGVAGNSVVMMTEFLNWVRELDWTTRFVVLFDQPKYNSEKIPMNGEWAILFGDLIVNNLDNILLRDSNNPSETKMVNWSNRANYMIVSRDALVRTFKHRHLENLEGDYREGGHRLRANVCSIEILKN